MSEKRVVFSGSFDPITNGHVEMIRRAAAAFGSLCVVVCSNSSKGGLLTPAARKRLIEDAIADLPNVTADICDGLFADYCHANHVKVTVKGVRSAADYEYEHSLCRMNKAIFAAKGYEAPETVLLLADPRYEYCSSTFVREMLRYGEDCSRHVPNEALLRSLCAPTKKNNL